MATYKTPGVYIEEISKLPPSVAEVETAIPAFIGFTEKDTLNGISLNYKPTRIKSLNDYVDVFGGPDNTTFETTAATSTISLSGTGVADLSLSPAAIVDPYSSLRFRMYYALQLYFVNGGGPCYIISCGNYTSASFVLKTFTDALDVLKKEDEPTMILFPDAPGLTKGDFYSLYVSALKQCGELMDRVTIVDLFVDKTVFTVPSKKDDGAFEKTEIGGDFRSGIGNSNLSYAAAYYPWLKTTLNYYLDESKQKVSGPGLSTDPADPTMLRKYPVAPAVTLTSAEEGKSLYHMNSQAYAAIKKEIDKFKLILPPSSAIAGVYAAVDNTRGVWKAPANVSLSYVKEPCVKIDDEDQKDMNVTSTGKSVNAIRSFTGKGILVWGARTLAGNDNEWRYISVRRFYNMVEESVKKASEPFVFEPNDKNTWVKVKAMIENYLVLKWRDGALMGAKPEEAFFVHVGLGETMTALDIFEGRMIIEIGMAVVRPAEFIILRFSHKMAVS
jgi:uncharacterized protein